MQSFAMRPTSTDMQPSGLIVQGAQCELLIEKLKARQAHYAALHLSRGDGWLALFAKGNRTPELPWISPPLLYLHQLSETLLCQTGMAPDLPPHLLPNLGGYLRRLYGLSGLLAMTSETRVFALGQGTLLADVNLAAL